MDELLIFANKEVLFKLIMAGTLSLIIGIERELKRKPVGLKTSMAISCFSCLLTIISIETAYNTPVREDINITMDPLRLAAQIVSGIGFLGAGVILRKGNNSITGLTTAAMIWGAAGIGIAVGAGFYIYAALTVIIIFIGIEIISPLVIRFGPKRLRTHEGTLKVSLSNIDEVYDLTKQLKNHNVKVENVSIKDSRIHDEIVHNIYIRFSSFDSNNTISIYTALASLPYVTQIELEYLH